MSPSQLLPFESHRSQRASKLVGLFVHAPAFAVSVWPTLAVPEIVGREVFAGSGPLGATTAVGADVALSDPKAFLAFTCTRIV